MPDPVPFALTRLADLEAGSFDDIIDVRAPSEFSEDHIPGAVNLPVLSDAERARVGTVYVQQSSFLARRMGAALVARNAARHLEGYLAGKGPRYAPLVHCWRGGQRSGAFATILGQIGWRVRVLEGGYRAYRRLVKEVLYDTPFPAPVVLLDGNTGTAKTDLLHLLAGRGVQVLDLEGLARHRGSLFGALPGGQPAQKGFESALAAQVAKLDPERPVVVEAESNKIGELLLPPTLWRAMRAAPRIAVSAPLQARAAYLARAYADLSADAEALAAVIDKLRPFQPARRIAHWQDLAAAARFIELASELMAHHYDPRYARSAARHARGPCTEIEARSLAHDALPQLADRIHRTLAQLPRGLPTS